MSLRIATPGDAPAVAAVINAAFGGTGGWTSEADLVHGDRTDADEIRRMICDADLVFVLLEHSGRISGCAYVKRMGGDEAYLGLLAVDPTAQGAGIGSRVIAEAERIASHEWRCRRIALTTMTRHRPEMAVYYERRGYARTGRFEPLQRKDAEEKAKVRGLVREWMVKPLSAASDPR
jgi:GNAT superfamily N-acetyltransferase